MSNSAWNPRYLAYCRAHKLAPEQMMEHDREAWPGGCMCGFILWHSAKLAEAKRTHPEFFYIGFAGIDGLLDHKGYDKWLNASVA
jgi:hypothetical protein